VPSGRRSNASWQTGQSTAALSLAEPSFDTNADFWNPVTL